MSSMVPTGSKYSDDQRTEAATQYEVTGSFKKTSKITGIPKSTLQDWARTEWFKELTVMVRSEKNSRHRARFSKIVDMAQAQTIKELPNATAQQASIISGVAFDKIRLIDNQPTSIRGDSATVQALVAEFDKLSQDHKNIRDSVVAVQVDDRDEVPALRTFD